MTNIIVLVVHVIQVLETASSDSLWHIDVSRPSQVLKSGVGASVAFATGTDVGGPSQVDKVVFVVEIWEIMIL